MCEEGACSTSLKAEMRGNNYFAIAFNWMTALVTTISNVMWMERVLQLTERNILFFLYEGVQISTMVAVLVSHAVSSFWNRQKFTRITNELPSTRKLTLLQLIMIGSLLLSRANFLYNLYLYNNEWWFPISGMGTYYFGTSTQVQFVGIVTDIGKRFAQIHPLPNDPSQNDDGMRRRFQLMSLYRTVTDAYKWQVLFFSLSTGAGFVHVGRIFVQAWVEGEIVRAGICVARLLGTLTMLLIIIEACEQLKFKVNAFNIELFKMMQMNEHLCRDKKLFLYVTLQQTVNFTACGFFKLEYPLVTSIIAAATTYLVILLQFNMPTFQEVRS